MSKNNGTSMPAQLSASTVAAHSVFVTFRDKAFRSRTIVFEDGSTLTVEKSTVVISNEEQIAKLELHPDFERAADGS